MYSKLDFTHLGFGEQGSEAPERSSANRASTNPLKAVLRLNLLPRRTLHWSNLKGHFHISVCSSSQLLSKTHKEPERLVQTSILHPDSAKGSRKSRKRAAPTHQIHKDLVRTAATRRTSWWSKGNNTSSCLCVYSTSCT